MRKIDPSKSCGPDELLGHLLKQGATHLVSLCLMTRYQQTSSGKESSIYQPVSHTCIAIKLLERLVYNNLTNFLSSNNKLSSSQHGFFELARPNCLKWYTSRPNLLIKPNLLTWHCYTFPKHLIQSHTYG